MLKKACPDLTEQARDQLMAAVAAARNEWVAHTERLIAERVAAAMEEAEELDGPEAFES